MQTFPMNILGREALPAAASSPLCWIWLDSTGYIIAVGVYGRRHGVGKDTDEKLGEYRISDTVLFSSTRYFGWKRGESGSLAIGA